jgi:PleD family two-component response regulator
MRVLACTVPEAETRLRKLLAGEEVQFAFATEDALRALIELDFDLLIIGMLFDESRGLELMQRISEKALSKDVPIVGIRGAKVRRAISDNAYDVPMRSMGACDVIDVDTMPDDEAGNLQIRERLIMRARSRSKPA